MTVKKLIRMSISAAFLSLVPIPPAAACSCAPWPGERPSASVEMKGEGAVFTGRVDRVRNVGEYLNLSIFHGYMPRVMVRIQVDRAWKGVRAGSRVWVITSMQGGMCGYPFDRGRDYLVYATNRSVALKGKRKPDRILSTSICARTKGLDRAGADLVDLGEPESAKPKR